MEVLNWEVQQYTRSVVLCPSFTRVASSSPMVFNPLQKEEKKEGNI
jgi:hypothetical protein